MKITKDLSYCDMRIVNNGYGKLGVYSLRFDRYFNEIEQADNLRNAEFERSHETKNLECEKVSNPIAEQMKTILNYITKNYKVYQLNFNGKYDSDEWDFYFYYNAELDRNGITYFTLNFNDARSFNDNMKLFADIMRIVKSIREPNIQCFIQYKTVCEDNRLFEDANNYYMKNAGKTFNTSIGKAKIKRVGENSYGVFRLHCRKRYLPIDCMTVIAACRGSDCL